MVAQDFNVETKTAACAIAGSGHCRACRLRCSIADRQPCSTTAATATSNPTPVQVQGNWIGHTYPGVCRHAKTGYHSLP